MNDSLTMLLDRYSKQFETVRYNAVSCGKLKSVIPAKVTGVYVITGIHDNRVIYIGSSGKITKGMKTSGSSIRGRLFTSTTPYHFDKNSDEFRYGPTTAGVPPQAYKYSIPVSGISVTCISVTSPKAPSALEHLLIQGHINEHGDLPSANQKI